MHTHIILPSTAVVLDKDIAVILDNREHKSFDYKAFFINKILNIINILQVPHLFLPATHSWR